jgi:ribosome-associated protein
MRYYSRRFGSPGLDYLWNLYQHLHWYNTYMLPITSTFSIAESDLQIVFVASSGPGGQNVNKVATQAQLRFNTAGLPEDVRLRLAKLAAGRLTSDGVLLIQARRYRTQERNRQDALARLVALLRKAAEPPAPRKRTRIPSASRKQRLENKRRAGEVKKMRQRVDGEM